MRRNLSSLIKHSRISGIRGLRTLSAQVTDLRIFEYQMTSDETANGDEWRGEIFVLFEVILN